MDIEKLEDAPKREKMSVRHNDSYHRVNFYPRLHRFLTSRLGQKVNDVFSEFVKAKWIPAEYRNFHVFNRQVIVNTFLKDGKIFYNSDYYTKPQELEQTTTFRPEFYAHPLTQRLEVQAVRKFDYGARRREEMDKYVRILGAYHQLYKENGIWYEVKAEVIPRRYSVIGYGPALKPHDIILEKSPGFMPSFKVTLKHQLNNRELKKYGLVNDSGIPVLKKCPKCGGYRCGHRLT